jgi:hypothetical protein
MNETRTETGWLLKGLLALFGLTYALGTIYFLLGWLGWQSLPSAWQRASLPFHACVFSLGAVSVAGAVRWKRWGVYGLALTWAATAALNALFLGPISLPAAATATLLAILFALQVHRDWSRFR